MTQTTDVPGAVEYYPSADCWVEEGGKVFLMGSRCPTCAKHAFPRRTFCDACGTSAGLGPARLSHAGTLYSFADVYAAPKVFATPFVIGYVDFPGDVRVLGQVEHALAELTPGDRVEVVLGVIRTSDSGRPVISYKFRKSGGPSHA